MKNILLALLLLSAPVSFARSYNTSFLATENPISEGGNWINCGTVGLDWTNARTTTGLAFGTEPGNVGDFDDSTALLTGVWGPNQTAQATVRIVSGDTSQFEEVALRLRSACSPHVATGYEVLFSVKPGNAYAQIVRWNGPLGNFTLLNAISLGVKNGDVVKATIVGNVITGYINGVAIVSATDNTYATGQPGMGFYLHGGSGTNANYGFASYTVTDGLVNNPPSPPTSLKAVVH